jgi:thiamine-monophosphate kinase
MAREDSVLSALLGDRPRSPRPGFVGIGDDACVVPAAAWRGGPVLATTDALEESVHFRPGWLSIDDLAWKLLAVNLSDLAAMGAEPVGYLLSVAWPEALPAGDARRLGRALAEAEAAHDCPLLGGDTDVRPGPLRLEATVLGTVPPGVDPLLRSGARAGDALFVTGELGGAAACVARWLRHEAVDEGQAAWRDAALRFRRPCPRLDVGRALRGRAHAVIDLSDGLSADLGHLARASGLAARVWSDAVPVAAAARAEAAGFDLAVGGGEDYELLVAGPASLAAEVPGLVRVGEVEDGPAGTVTFVPATAARLP